MIKKTALIFLAFLMLTTAGCRKKTEEPTVPSTAEETVETQEKVIPGIEASSFDDELPTEQAETVTEATEDALSATEQKENTDASSESSTQGSDTKTAVNNSGSSSLASEPKDSTTNAPGGSSVESEPKEPAADVPGSSTVETMPKEENVGTAPEVVTPTEALTELPEPGTIDFETFQNMEPSMQREYQESFESLDAFYDWFVAVQEAYAKENAPIEVGNGVIDMGEILDNQ